MQPPSSTSAPNCSTAGRRSACGRAWILRVTKHWIPCNPIPPWSVPPDPSSGLDDPYPLPEGHAIGDLLRRLLGSRVIPCGVGVAVPAQYNVVVTRLALPRADRPSRG